jgi:hypothetical protein
MYRKHLSSLIIFSVFSLVFISCKNKIKKIDKSSPKPNIVVIYTDDLGFGDISANGAKEIKTLKQIIGSFLLKETYLCYNMLQLVMLFSFHQTKFASL